MKLSYKAYYIKLLIDVGSKTSELIYIIFDKKEVLQKYAFDTNKYVWINVCVCVRAHVFVNCITSKSR